VREREGGREGGRERGGRDGRGGGRERGGERERERQELEVDHFRNIMGRQLKRYTQRRLSDALHLSRHDTAE
jgi:hypothetical protein